MKKLLLLLVMVSLGVATASAQKYYIPKFKKTKEVRDFELDSNRKIYVTLGASLNLGLGFQDFIQYQDHGYDVSYDEDMKTFGASALLGVGCRLTENFHAGIESGMLIQHKANAMPLYASLKYYYGPATKQKRTRFFNYLNGGPQFYFKSNTKPVGYMVGAGGGMRLLFLKTLRTDFYAGYQLNMRSIEPSMSGTEKVDASTIKFRQFAHLIQVGINVPIF